MWTHGEPGPKCFCGRDTNVMICADGKVNLMCLAHTKEETALFPLPATRPEKWPDMTNEEMQALVDQGFLEHERD